MWSLLNWGIDHLLLRFLRRCTMEGYRHRILRPILVGGKHSVSPVSRNFDGWCCCDWSYNMWWAHHPAIQYRAFVIVWRVDSDAVSCVNLTVTRTVGACTVCSTVTPTYTSYSLLTSRNSGSRINHVMDTSRTIVSLTRILTLFPDAISSMK